MSIACISNEKLPKQETSAAPAPVSTSSTTPASAASIAVFQPVPTAAPSQLATCSTQIRDVEDLIAFDGGKRRCPPVVPYLCPMRANLVPGEVYRWCSCGRSEEQPFCDETCDQHDDGFRPLKFSVQNTQKIWHLCGCKYTAMAPWCDGSHIHAIEGFEEQKKKQAATTSIE